MTKEKILNIVSKAKENTVLSSVDEYKVLNDHCIVVPVVFKDKQRETMGIVNPDNYDDKNEYGVIIALGPGRITENGVQIEPSFVVGDVVLYGPYSYTKLRVEGTDLNLIRHDDIIAVLPRRGQY